MHARAASAFLHIIRSCRLKQEFGLDNFEGRNWRGFHHHATLCIAAYGFLVGERLTRGKDTKKNCAFRTPPSLSEGYARRAASPSSTTRR
jgi:SRSO17 transposase